MELLSERTQPTGREIARILAGLMLALFICVMSTMIVTNALPSIVASLGGSQSEYTWLVAASLLMMTVSTPIWGRCADQFNKKTLVRSALGLFLLGSIGAGLSQSIWMLICMRGLQGIAMGGLMATTQAVIASIVPPRQSGRYSSYISLVMVVATLCGPLVGGLIVDTDWLGWRWCFFVVVPPALASLAVLQRYLHLPVHRRETRVDYLGSLLVAVTVTLLLLWVTFAGEAYAWLSWQTAAILTGTLLMGVLTVYVERRHPNPILALPVLRDRTTAWASIGSFAVGVVMFSSMVFLSQYFQLARGYSPTEAGLLSMPMLIGTAAATLAAGHLIAKFGRWKAILVAGSAVLALGLALIGRLDDAPAWTVPAAAVLVGVGIGVVIQNYVLIAQNAADPTQVGTAGATVTFFRSLGGVLGMSALGAIVTSGVGAQADLDLATLTPALREAAQASYADALGLVFVVSGAVAAVSLVAAVVIRETPLRTTVHRAKS
ncbi:MFS transporter [Sinosporangium siamense]|uniref:Major facilitator superfamily (MFS) profile domain-containing protein n=1 Tax=Sinosporangium siamense TaxID=1367973 RepID=A0A919RIH2_9ACTN|nr:MFS transporter [Sinosporangium siamense]GII92469.1 hypothetical protein Ssi02_27000 [Sinosporangium siamense]